MSVFISRKKLVLILAYSRFHILKTNITLLCSFIMQ